MAELVAEEERLKVSFKLLVYPYCSVNLDNYPYPVLLLPLLLAIFPQDTLVTVRLCLMR